jgi:kynurenine formamidase
MCDPLVIEAVKQSMLQSGERILSTASRAAGWVPLPPTAQQHTHIIDLTHELHEDFPTLVGRREFARKRRVSYTRAGINIFELTMSEHVGTHIDAPLHFTEHGQSVNEIPLERLVSPLCVIDIRQKCSSDYDAQLTVDDILRWVSDNGPMPDGASVAMNSGWSAHMGTEKFRNAGADDQPRFPGIHPEAAEYLLSETSTVGLAVDTLSLDHGKSKDYRTHKVWLSAGRWGIECVANLENLPPVGATLIVGAPKHVGGTGGQARLFAMV